MRLLPTSLFGRMFALSLLATLAALVVAGVAIGGVLERFVTGGIDARLGDRLVALESVVRLDGSLDNAQLARVTARIPPDEPWRIDAGDAHIGSTDANGRLTIEINDDPHWGGPPLPMTGSTTGPRGPAGTPEDTQPRPFDARLNSELRVHGMIGSLPTRTGTGIAQAIAAVPRNKIDRPVLAALAPLGASLAILGLALGGAALLQLRVGLRPLTTLHTAVEAIRHGRATRVPEDVPDELAPLAHELNALAADNAAALSGARAAAANLAHALKTPVATLSLHLGDDPVAREQLTRIEATLRHHLGRARAAAINRRAITTLAPALTDLAEAIAALHRGRVRLRLNVAEHLAAAIDPHDLDELVGNLMDNAARHAAATVVVGASAEGRRVLITVEDDGPGISAADRERAIMPGVRLDERADGHGFGLAIARELAELYGGTLVLSDHSDAGLVATVTLPTAA